MILSSFAPERNSMKNAADSSAVMYKMISMVTPFLAHRTKKKILFISFNISLSYDIDLFSKRYYSEKRGFGKEHFLYVTSYEECLMVVYIFNISIRSAYIHNAASNSRRPPVNRRRQNGVVRPCLHPRESACPSHLF
jgi:hypothetical protein